MKLAFPIILTEVSKKHFSGYAVNVPDLDIDTQGENIADAISMARDAIGMWACFDIDEGRKVPQPSSTYNIAVPSGSTLAFVDIDIDAYRRAHDNRSIRKNLTLPSWLNDLSENAGFNFSQVLQDALKAKLNIQDR